MIAPEPEARPAPPPTPGKSARIAVTLLVSAAAHAAVVGVMAETLVRQGVEARTEVVSATLILEAPAAASPDIAASAGAPDATFVAPGPTPELPDTPPRVDPPAPTEAKAPPPSEDIAVMLASPPDVPAPESPAKEPEAQTATVDPPPPSERVAAILSAPPVVPLPDAPVEPQDISTAAVTETSEPLAAEPDLPDHVASTPTRRPQPQPKRTAETKTQDRASARKTTNRQKSPPPEKAARGEPTQVQASAGSTARSGASAGEQAAYGRRLNRHLQRYKNYPKAAERARVTGATRLSVTIDRAGGLRQARIVGSSGHKMLDEEAMAVARRASPYPAQPETLGGKPFTFFVTLRFAP
jgi:protein TonB